MSIEPSSNPQSGDVVTVDRKQVAPALAAMEASGRPA